MAYPSRFGQKGGLLIHVLVIGKGSYENNLYLALTARALGASAITITGRKDRKILKHISSTNRKWGGRFSVSFTNDYRKILKGSNRYKKVYLTRYGLPLNKFSYVLRTYKNILLIVTLRENPGTIHNLSDFNISISDQPHSASASVAIFLHDFFGGRELAMHFENAKYKVVPKERGVDIEKVARRLR